MARLLFTCPNTSRKASTGIEMDVQGLRQYWKLTLKFDCPHCDDVHDVRVREVYIESAVEGLEPASSVRWCGATMIAREASVLLSSHHFAAHSFANFGIEKHWQHTDVAGRLCCALAATFFIQRGRRHNACRCYCMPMCTPARRDCKLWTNGIAASQNCQPCQKQHRPGER